MHPVLSPDTLGASRWRSRTTAPNLHHLEMRADIDLVDGL